LFKKDVGRAYIGNPSGTSKVGKGRTFLGEGGGKMWWPVLSFKPLGVGKKIYGVRIVGIYY